MKLQKTIVVVLASLCAVLGAALWAQAQPQRGDGFVIPPAWKTAPVQPVTPTVLSDGDVGFRVIGMRGQTPVGEWLVRINGVWREAETGSSYPGLQMR